MKKHMFIFMGVIVISAIIAFVAFKSFQPISKSKYVDNDEDKSAQQLPPIISKIKTLEIVNAKVVNPGTPNAVVLIEVKNNSPKPIVTISVESGDEKDTSGNTIGSFANPPNIIGKPFETFTIDFPVNNIVRGLPIRISGVFYIDGSGDGEEKSLERMRKTREKFMRTFKGGSN